MKEKTTRQTHPASDSFKEFEDHELKSTMSEFLKEEEKENTNIWNFATITGLAMFFVAMLYLLQSVGLSIGPDLGELVGVMPLIGAALITLVGFGFLVGDRRKAKRQRKREKQQKQRKASEAFGSFDFGTASADEDPAFELENDLNRSGSRSNSGTGAFDFDSYALRKSRKLYKSRTDRKWAGVCGGLARYFGISSTVIRLLFVITFLAGWGTSLIVYIALAIALDKEPPELMDDFDF